MGMNTTPKGERLHIALFGKRNAGKSSLINAITGQQLAIVSEIKGTTTDPVYKAMELLPLGSVMFIDTPGLDDEGTLGTLRVQKAKEVLRKTDIALLVVDGSSEEECAVELELEEELRKKQIPYLWVVNKSDLGQSKVAEELVSTKEQILFVSKENVESITRLKEEIARIVPAEEDRRLVRDLVELGDLVVLVVPIDKAAPKGRLILPQQQVIRDVLEKGGIPVVVRDTELAQVFDRLAKKPKMVITDSQAFETVNQIVPKEIPLTSFSILMARYKGNLKFLTDNAHCVEELKDGDKILMAEGCTHHRQCGDIGTVKLPNWIREYTGKKLIFETASGTGFPEDLTSYAMVVHCGSCMLPAKEMKYRMQEAKRQQVPMVNYGIMIAYLKGIVKRSLELFPDL